MVKLFTKSYDGGADSGVTGYWLIESKRLFSVVLLHFSPGSREAYHSHAFNALTWWLKGAVSEEFLDGTLPKVHWRRNLKPKYTKRNNFHKVNAGPKGAWALSIRGPWDETWFENKNGNTYTLTHGRKMVGYV